MTNTSQTFKFIIVGSMGTGKTSLMTRFTENDFYPEIPHTMGVEFATKIVTVMKEPVKIQIWDTAGQERFRAVTRSYFRGSAGVLLVFDVTRRSTFNQISGWLNDAKTLTNPNSVIFLVGNKIDLEDRQVSREEAENFALENELQYMETSAKTGNNVEETFMETARVVYERVKQGKLDVTATNARTKTSEKISVKPDSYVQMQKKKTGCC
ncbi:ras-related protein rab-4a [Anaeramoeba ignava]|uniref:Ras-related protein rab-4a n=1 Tax=Anaeramoeba ignava TaxID=1746090 RepID=A0A9Q0LPZ1_ANAIG|nr:ras-related protein rab-4a [Anaeramoeba ignava]